MGRVRRGGGLLVVLALLFLQVEREERVDDAEDDGADDVVPKCVWSVEDEVHQVTDDAEDAGHDGDAAKKEKGLFHVQGVH